MSIVTPPVYTPLHQEETDFMEAMTEEVIRKLIYNNNFLLDLAPIGTIVFVNPNQLGGQQPNSAFWQICDGSEITNPNSPIRSIGTNLRYTPNLRDLYPCGAQSVSLNPTYGSHIHNLKHQHTTGGASSDGGGLKKKGKRNRRNPHSHILKEQYTEDFKIEAPAFVYLVAYMKIV